MVRIVKSPVTLMLLEGATKVEMVGVTSASVVTPFPPTGPTERAAPVASASLIVWSWRVRLPWCSIVPASETLIVPPTVAWALTTATIGGMPLRPPPVARAMLSDSISMTTSPVPAARTDPAPSTMLMFGEASATTLTMSIGPLLVFVSATVRL